MDGNIEEWQKELDSLYCIIGGAKSSEVEDLLDLHNDRMTELELLITPPLPRYEMPLNCTCGRGDCWECVYADDPMGI